MIFAVVPSRRHDPAVFGVEIALLRSGNGMLIPGMAPVDRVAERVLCDEYLLVFPIVVIGAPEEDSDPQMDLHEIGGDEFPIDDDSGSNKHLASPSRHVPVSKIAVLWILKTSPAAEHNPPLSHALIARQGIVKKIEQIVVHRYDTLHELHVAHQPAHVFREELVCRYGADPAGIKR